MAVSTIKKALKTISGTLTTGTTGNIELTNVLPTNAVPIVAQCTAPYMGVPFKAGNTWYLKCFAYNTANSFSTPANASITFTIWYLD